MEFLKANMGTIVVGFIVFALLISVAARLIYNARRGKTGCGCACGACPKCGERVSAVHDSNHG